MRLDGAIWVWDSAVDVCMIHGQVELGE